MRLTKFGIEPGRGGQGLAELLRGPDLFRLSLLAGLLGISWWSAAAGLVRLAPAGGAGYLMAIPFAGVIVGLTVWLLNNIRGRALGPWQPVGIAGYGALAMILAVLAAQAFAPLVRGAVAGAGGWAAFAAFSGAALVQVFTLALFLQEPRAASLPETLTGSEAERLSDVMAALGDRRLPSRQVFQNGLVWFEGGCRLVVPVTGPYEAYRPTHTEDLIGLAHSLADAGFIFPYRQLGGRSGEQELKRRFRGTTRLSPPRERYTAYQLTPSVIPHILRYLRD